MRAPTVPEQLVAAVALLFVAVCVTAGLSPDIRWLDIPFAVLGVAIGAWLTTAVQMMRMQHRLAAAYNERIRQAQAASGGKAPTWAEGLANMGVAADDMRRALGFEGQPASRPVREEQTE